MGSGEFVFVIRKRARQWRQLRARMCLRCGDGREAVGWEDSGRARGLNPDFGGDGLENKSNPESNSEEIVRRKTSEARGGEEEADDGTDGGDGEPNGEGAEHPFAMEGDFAAANVEEGFGEGDEKERAEERCGGGLVDAANRGHGPAHDNGGDADNVGGGDKDATGDAMVAGMAPADGGAELKRSEEHEQDSRNNVGEGEPRMAIEGGVKRSKAGGNGTI